MTERISKIPLRASAIAIPVRSRRVIGTHGTRLELLVPCPEQDRDVALEACSRCTECTGLHADPLTQAVVITCTGTTAEVAAAPAPSDDADSTPISRIMSREVVCLRKDVSVATLGPMLLSMDVSGAAVIDEAGIPVGILSQSDVLTWLYSADGLRPSNTVEQTVEALMTTPALCLSENDFIARAIRFISTEGIHRVPIVGTHGQLVGMLSPLDILRWMASHADG